jgi:hypothetical protein
MEHILYCSEPIGEHEGGRYLLRINRGNWLTFETRVDSNVKEGGGSRFGKGKEQRLLIQNRFSVTRSWH